MWCFEENIKCNITYIKSIELIRISWQTCRMSLCLWRVCMSAALREAVPGVLVYSAILSFTAVSWQRWRINAWKDQQEGHEGNQKISTWLKDPDRIPIKCAAYVKHNMRQFKSKHIILHVFLAEYLNEATHYREALKLLFCDQNCTILLSWDSWGFILYFLVIFVWSKKKKWSENDEEYRSVLSKAQENVLKCQVI